MSDPFLLLTRAEAIFASLEKLNLPVPRLQYKSDTNQQSLERAIRYLNLICGLAEDDRFRAELFDDTKEYLEQVCADENTRYVLRRIKSSNRE